MFYDSMKAWIQMISSDTGVMIDEYVCNFLPFCNVVDIFLKNRSIDFNQNHSECKT